MHRNVKIVIFDEWHEKFRTLKNSVFITGFPGFGATGYIATRYIVSKLKLSRIGVILTKYMPEYTLRDEELDVVFPYELYTDTERKIIVLVNHTLPSERLRTEFAEAIAEWIKNKDIKLSILIGGLDTRLREGNEELRWLKTSKCDVELSEPKMSKGLYIIGPLALLIMMMELNRVPALVILPYAEPLRPDPRAAAVAVRKVSELTGMRIDTAELISYAKIIEETERIRREAEEATRKLSTSDRMYI